MTSPLNTDPNATMGNPLYQGALGVNPNTTSNTPAMPNFGTTYPTARGDSMADMVYGDDFGSLGNPSTAAKYNNLSPSGVGGAVPQLTMANGMPLGQYGANLSYSTPITANQNLSLGAGNALSGMQAEALIAPSGVGGAAPLATNPLSQMATPSTTGYTSAPNLGVTPGTQASGSFAQGAPLPVTSTVQQAVTAAPSFYTDYLNQLATQGANTAQNAQFVGAQPLQQQAFNQVQQNVGNYQPTLQNAINLASSVGGTNLAQAVGDLGQANIANYLAPQATAGLVGSGQFGSSRGAQALGSTIANAELGITAQQQQALQQDQANRLAAAQQLGNLAGQTQALGLGDINALSTLGGQQQTIAQNQQLFPMQQLTNESALLRGYTIPTSVSTATTGPGQQGQFAMSPLQQIMGLGSLATGLATQNASGTTPGGNIYSGLKNLIGTSGGNGVNPSGLLGLLGGSGGIPASQSTGAGTSTQPLSMPVDTTGPAGSTAVDSSGNAIGTYDSNGDYTPYIQN
jgi:hypothetical protein